MPETIVHTCIIKRTSAGPKCGSKDWLEALENEKGREETCMDGMAYVCGHNTKKKKKE